MEVNGRGEGLSGAESADVSMQVYPTSSLFAVGLIMSLLSADWLQEPSQLFQSSRDRGAQGLIGAWTSDVMARYTVNMFDRSALRLSMGLPDATDWLLGLA